MKHNIIKLQPGLTSITKEQRTKKEKSDKEQFLEQKLLSESLGLGFTLVAPIAGGALLGAFLDQVFDTVPKLTLILLFTGLTISMLKLAQLARRGDNT